jgi:hypothetical protein
LPWKSQYRSTYLPPRYSIVSDPYRSDRH